MSYKDFIATVHLFGGQMGHPLPINELNDAVSLALFNMDYSQCVAADRTSGLPPFPEAIPYLDAVATHYGVDRRRLERPIRLALQENSVRTVSSQIGVNHLSRFFEK